MSAKAMVPLNPSVPPVPLVPTVPLVPEDSWEPADKKRKKKEQLLDKHLAVKPIRFQQVHQVTSTISFTITFYFIQCDLPGWYFF